jgi:CubicO group peptidase (beta-lactamase class C family)
LHIAHHRRARSGVQQDAIFRIASMTKPITSIAFMQLVEEGKVALSEPVAKYMPEFADLGVFGWRAAMCPFVTRPPATRLNIIDLLRHTTGFTYSFQERTPVDAAYRREKIDDFQSPRTMDRIRHCGGRRSRSSSIRAACGTIRFPPTSLAR